MRVQLKLIAISVNPENHETFIITTDDLKLPVVLIDRVDENTNLAEMIISEYVNCELSWLKPKIIDVRCSLNMIEISYGIIIPFDLEINTPVTLFAGERTNINILNTSDSYELIVSAIRQLI